MPWKYQDDPISGQRLLVNEQGLARFKDPNTGRVMLGPAEHAGRYIVDQGMAPATIDDVKADIDRRRSTAEKAATSLAAAGVAGARGTIGAITALPNLAIQAGVAGERLKTAAMQRAGEALGDTQLGQGLQQAAQQQYATAGQVEQVASEALPGSRVLENIGGIAAWDPSGSQEVRSEQQRLARQAPTATMTGEIGGNILGGWIAGGGSFGPVAGMRGIGYSALQGAAQAAQQSQEDAYLRGENPLRAEQYLANGAFGAVLGAAVPGAFELGGAGLRALGQRARGLTRGLIETAEDAGDTATAGLGHPYRAPFRGTSADDYAEAFGRANGVDPAPGLGAALKRMAKESEYSEIASVASGVDKEFIERVGAQNLTAEGRAARAAMIDPTIKERATIQLQDDLRRMVDLGNEQFREGIGDPKIKQIARLLEPKDNGRQIRSAMDQFDSMDLMTRSFDDVSNIGGTINRVGELLTRQREAMRGVKTAAEAFEVLDDTKRALQRQLINMRNSTRNMADPVKLAQTQALMQHIEQNVQEPTRMFLQDQSIWGRAGKAQEAINKQWHDGILQVQPKFRQQFADVVREEWVPGEGGKMPVWGASSDKVSSFVNGLGTPAKRDAEQYLRDYVRSTRDLADTMQQHFDLGPEGAARVGELKSIAERVEKTLFDTSDKIKLQNQLRMARETEGAGLGGALGLVTDLVARPGQTAIRLARLEAMGNRFDRELSGKIAGFLGQGSGQAIERAQAPGALARVKATGARAVQTAAGVAERATGTARAASRAAVPASIVVFGTDRRERKQEFRDRAAQIAALASTPERQQAALEPVMRGLTGAPVTAGAAAATIQRGIGYLQQTLPAGVDGSGLTPQLNRWNASDAEISRWGLRYKTVIDPLSTFDDLERGTLTHEQVETLQTVYPQIYQRMQQAALEACAERAEPVPYRKAIALDLLLDLNGAGHPSLSPRFLQLVESLGQRQQPQPAQQSIGRKPNISNQLSTDPLKELA